MTYHITVDLPIEADNLKEAKNILDNAKIIENDGSCSMVLEDVINNLKIKRPKQIEKTIILTGQKKFYEKHCTNQNFNPTITHAIEYLTQW